MEGERILHQILRGDVQQLRNLQNYIAPLEKLLNSDLMNCVQKKAADCESTVRKYGLFCMKLLRYCIEALSTERKQGDGRDHIVQEECFKCAELGSEMLCQLITRGITLPSNLSISGMTKLLFHLIINALKQGEQVHLQNFIYCLINITRRMSKKGKDNLCKDVATICKQASDHLWNAAIKLEQSNSMEKQKTAVMAFSLRSNSIDLLTVSKIDSSLIIERGLKAARQFQLSYSNISGSEDLQKFLFSILNNAVALIDARTTYNHVVEEGVCNHLDELCINCCKAAGNASHYIELLQLFSHLLKKDGKNVASQERLEVFKIVIQMLLCALCFHLKRAKTCENQKFNDDLKWNTLQKRITNLTEALRNLDSNLFSESQIIQAMDYLRFACNKFFNPKIEDTSSHNLDKIPQEMLSALVKLFSVCFNYQGQILKSKHVHPQLISNYSSWNSVVCPRLSILYLINSLVLKRSHDLVTKTHQNGRKVSFKHDYVSAMLDAKTMVDDVVEDVPAAVEHCRHLATDAFNTGLILFKSAQFNDAAILARLSCEAASTWHSKKGEAEGMIEVLLFKKYELLSDCLEKQGRWLESLRAMASCCQMFVLSSGNFAEMGALDSKALEYVEKWLNRKRRMVQQMGGTKETLQIKRCILDDGWEKVNGAASREKELCTLLKMELDAYRKKGYCTSIEQIAVIEKLVTVFTDNGDVLNACLIKLEKVKVMFQMSGHHNETSSYISHCLLVCEEIIANLDELLREHQDSIVIKDILASSHFWSFILQYSRAMGQRDTDGGSKDLRNESDDEEPLKTRNTQDGYEGNSLNLSPDFLLSLHHAVKMWTQMVDNMGKSNEKLDVLSLKKVSWNLQVASSVYGFLNMPMMRIHTLSVLAVIARAARGSENLQTLVVADSFSIQTFCEEGNVQYAEVLMKRCEEALKDLGEDCRPVVKHLFHVAKSQLLMYKGMYDDGWELVMRVLNEIKGSKKPVFQVLLLKAKLLCSRYLSLPPCTRKESLEDSEGYNHLEFLLGSLRHAEALVDHFVGEDENGLINIAGVGELKEEHGILLSHWSILNELSCCLMATGEVFLLQGAVREAKTYLEDGRNVGSKYYSPNRLSEFIIQLAELSNLKNEMELCENYLKHVFEIVRPGASLFEVVHKSESLELPSKWENSPFNEYDKNSVSKLHVQLLVAVCRYLRSMRKPCDVKTVISSLRNLHQISIEQYQISLESIECIFQATLEENSGQRTDEGLYIVSRKCTKKKAKKGKTATRPNVKKNQVASFACIENGLKIHALESDLALSEGDYTALLSSVQEGLKLVDWAHESARCPLLLNFMSTALLYYLRGVAHVLSSKAGFNSWKVAGCVPSTGDQRRDIEDVSEIMSGLEISPIVVNNDSVRTSRRERKTSGDVNGNHISLVRKLKEPALEDFDCNDDVHEEVEVETRKSQRNRSKLTKDPASEKTSKKTSARSRKMLSKKDNVANEVVESSSNPMESHVAGSGNTLRDDMHAKKNLKDVKKGSRCTKADIFNNDEVMAEGLTKRRRKVRGRKNSSLKNNNEECRNSKSRTGMIAKDALHKRKRPVGSRSSKSITTDYKINQSVADGPCRKCDLSSQAFRGQDEEILKALQCFHLSLEYLYPYYNPLLLTRICHAFLLCYGVTSPINAAIYHNLHMATTLRHQAVHSFAKKSRKLKEELAVEEIQGSNTDELVKLFDSMSLDNSNRASLGRLLYLRTLENGIGFKTSTDEIAESFNHLMDLLPKDWTVCTLSVVPTPEREDIKHLLVTRLRKNEEPLVLKLLLPNEKDESDAMVEDFQTGDSVVRNLSAVFCQNILSDFSRILQESAQSMELQNKREWWNRREQIDAQLKGLLQRLEDTWFGKWRGILSGCMLEEDNVSQLKANLTQLQRKASEIFGAPVKNEQLFEVLIEWYSYLKPLDVACALTELTGMQINSMEVTKFGEALKQFFDIKMGRNTSTTSVARGPVVLILDKAIQHLPFESMPILRGQEVSRMPSLEFVTSHLSLQKMTTSAPVEILTTGIDASKTFYVLNPKNDLPKTEKIFHEWFTQEKGWNGVVGRPPTSHEFKEALSSNHLFLYFGHGTGREFLKGDEVQRLNCKAVAVLMGCSSGKLIVQGNCDARGMVLNYLLSGCPAVVANLWDVTDGDIDRFSDALLKKWLKKDNYLSLTQCVSECRRACKLKYLIGSSPVVYGMPVYTQTSKKQTVKSEKETSKS